MKRTIKFNKDKNGDYIFVEAKQPKNRLIIGINDKKLSGKELYDAFFKDNKYKENDSFQLDNELKKPNGTDNHIFNKMKYLFDEIEKSFNDNK